MACDLTGSDHTVNDKVVDSDIKADFQWWPDPLSKEDEDLRRRAGRLLESLRRIPPLASDRKAWENDHEDVFGLFRRGCIDGLSAGMLEAPIYHNRQIEDAWLFLFEMRRRHPNRRKQVVECATSLGASYNWSMVLNGSKKIRASLESLLPALQKEILEAANAPELLAALSPYAPSMASNAPPPTVMSNAPTALASNGGFAAVDFREAQDDRRPPGGFATADFRGSQDDRRPQGRASADLGSFQDERRPPGVGSWPADEALSNSWPVESQSSVPNTAPRSQGEQHDRNPPFSGSPNATWPGAGPPGNMPQRSGPDVEWPQPVQRQSSQQRKDHSRNPFGPADSTGPPPVSPGAHLLSASFGLSPAVGKEASRTDMPPLPRGEESRQTFPQRRHSNSFIPSEPTSPPSSQWQQGHSWAPSSGSTPFSRPPPPNPNNPFAPRSRQQDSSLQRPTTPINGSSPSTPKPQSSEQDHSRQEANGAASGDPSAIARSMASRAGAQFSSTSRSATTHTQNAVNHARNMATQDKHEDSALRSKPGPGTSGQVRSQATALGQQFGSKMGNASTKASATARSGVAALSSKVGTTGSRSNSRTSSPENRSMMRNTTPTVPSSWAPPGSWATSPMQPRNRGSANGPPQRAADNDRRPEDTWS